MTKTTRNSKRKIDWRGIVAGVLIITALIGAIIVNMSRTVNDAAKVTGTIDTDNGDLKINWDRYQAVDIDLTDSLTITESGTYHLTGSVADGYIAVDAGVGEVRLILDNVSI